MSQLAIFIFSLRKETRTYESFLAVARTIRVCVRACGQKRKGKVQSQRESPTLLRVRRNEKYDTSVFLPFQLAFPICTVTPRKISCLPVVKRIIISASSVPDFPASSTNRFGNRVGWRWPSIPSASRRIINGRFNWSLGAYQNYVGRGIYRAISRTKYRYFRSRVLRTGDTFTENAKT